MSTSREAFFARIRAALGKGTGTLPATEPDLVRTCAVDADLVGRFVQGATGLGMEVHRGTRAELGARLATLAKAQGWRTATVSPAEGQLLAAARSALQVVDWRAQPGLAAHYDVDVGVTDAAAGLAETGSLVVRADVARSRGAFLVPPAHVCVLHASRIVADLVDLWGEARGTWPSSLTIVSGPSKTADIEGILITGVHGPRAVHVLLCEDA